MSTIHASTLDPSTDPPMTGAGQDIGRIIESDAPVVIDDLITNCTEIPFNGYAGGLIFIPAGSTGSILDFFVHFRRKDGSPIQLYDTTGAAVSVDVTTIAAGGCAVPFPDALFGAQSFRIKGRTADVTETAGITKKS